jgi:hypothetical protein
MEVLSPKSGTTPALEPAEGPKRQRDGSVWPAITLALVFLSLSILFWPPLLERMVSLNWRAGDMRPAAYGLHAVFGALALGTALGRKWVSSRFYGIFHSGREFFYAVIAIVLCFGCLGIAGEGVARLLNLPFRPKWAVASLPMTRFDPELGYTYIPNLSVTQEFGSQRREIPMYFDDLGRRIREPGDRANPSAPTALFVGCSYTFGHGVMYDESFVGRLALMPDIPLQMVDFGVQGQGTDQALLMLKRQFKKFNTKVVVYTFIPPYIRHNGLYDTRVTSPRDKVYGTKPLFALRPDGSLYLAKSPVEIKDYSYSHVWAAFQILKARWGPVDSFRLTRALVKEMKQFAESNGAKFVVVDWYKGSEYERGEYSAGMPWGPDLQQNVIRIGPNPVPGWSDWTIAGDWHPDPRQHRYVAELLAQRFKSILTTN